MLLPLILAAAVHAKPTMMPSKKQCDAFANFTHKWNPLPETLYAWVNDNCDRIWPRPADMTCQDVSDFVNACNFTANGPHLPKAKLPPSETSAVSYEHLAAEYFRQSLGRNRAAVLPQYIYSNRQTAQDFSQFGNRYWPNFYPLAYTNDPAGPDVPFTLQTDQHFSTGGHYQYNRADNLINTALQQTWLPLCLHDLFFCIRGIYFSSSVAAAFTTNQQKQ